MRVAEPGSTNLGNLVADHAEELAPLLGVSPAWLHGRRATLDDHLAVDLGRVMHLRADGIRTATRRAAEQRSIDAAARLAATATVTVCKAEIDAALLLGDLLADPSRMFIALALDGEFSVAVFRNKLVQVARTLNRRELASWVDANGLHLRWRGGRGGLDLYPQPVAHEAQGRVIHVVFAHREQFTATCSPRRNVAAAWLGSALTELMSS